MSGLIKRRDSMTNGLIIPSNGSGLVAYQSSDAIRHELPDIADQYDYQRMVSAVKNAVKSHELSIADLESQVAIAETLPEAMERGDVRREHAGAYHLGTQEVSPGVIDRWRKLAGIPAENRRTYYEDMETCGKRPSRSGLMKWQQERTIDVQLAEPSRIEDLAASGPFSTVYADPPWQYSNQGTRASTNKHYKTMKTDDICELPVAGIVADKSLLFIWTTNGFLEETLTKVIPAWGFEFKSSMVWVKPQIGIGNYVRNAHEFLLIANRGGLIPDGKRQISWIQADRKSHSAKPDAFRKVVEDIAPAPRIELFSRQEMSGWSCWGDQVKRMEATLI